MNGHKYISIRLFLAFELLLISGMVVLGFSELEKKS